MAVTQECDPAEPSDQASDRLLKQAEEGRNAEDAGELPESSHRPAYSLECILAEIY